MTEQLQQVIERTQGAVTPAKPGTFTDAPGSSYLSMLQRSVGNAAVCRLMSPGHAGPTRPVPAFHVPVVQREIPSKPSLPSKTAVEGLRDRASGLQTKLGAVVGTGKTRTGEVRNFWTAVNGVYERVYRNYAMVLAQGGAAARKEQIVVNVLIGTAIGIFADIALPATIINAALRQVISEVSPNIAQVPMQFKAGGSDAAALPAQLPQLKQLQAVTALDQLQSGLLELADPAPQFLGALALAAEHLVGEVRVAQADGHREMTDPQVQADFQKIETALNRLSGLDAQLQAATRNFETLGKHFKGLTVPTDQRMEQDVWIEWIAAQGGTPYALNNRPIVNHLQDIGLTSSEDGLSGRLSVNFGRWIDTWEIEEAGRGAASQLPGVMSSWQRLFGIVAG